MTFVPREFFMSDDVVSIARQLLGKVLVARMGGVRTSGIITETEAYHQDEKACHAYKGRRTSRTEFLFHPGGKAYIYLCYGIHHLFNVTTGNCNEAAAVLIRAIQPVEGLKQMLLRRNHSKVETKLTSGPGTLTQALGISVKYTGVTLNNESGIWIEESAQEYQPAEIVTSRRIGVSYAREDALLPWRFYIKNNKWVSKL